MKYINGIVYLKNGEVYCLNLRKDESIKIMKDET